MPEIEEWVSKACAKGSTAKAKRRGGVFCFLPG